MITGQTLSEFKMRTFSKGKASVVLTDGVFDLIHANHLSLLMEASTYGEKLIVAVVSDAQAESFKRRPVI